MCELCAQTTAFDFGAVVFEHLLQRLEHMGVAKIPGGARAVVHDPVVLLGVGHQPGILRGIEEALAIAQRIGLRFCSSSTRMCATARSHS